MLADTTSALARWWAPALAFVAGIVSFASPCVFPLVPGYLSFVTGASAVDGGMAGDADQPRSRRILPIVLFIGGFTLVFALLGAVAASVTGAARTPRALRRVSFVMASAPMS